jgi:cytochrome oxidase Cu insertion factor (SCO1/SenC/PrrC family)
MGVATEMKRKRPIFIICLVLIAGFLGMSAKYAYLEESKNKIDAFDFNTLARILDPRVKAPEFSLTDLTGARVELKKLLGKVVMINFKTTW